MMIDKCVRQQLSHTCNLTFSIELFIVQTQSNQHLYAQKVFELKSLAKIYKDGDNWSTRVAWRGFG